MPTRALLIVVAVTACACAARSVEPPVVTPPRYPDFLVPVAPAGVPPALTAALDRGWRFLQAGDLPAAEREFAGALTSAPTFYPAETALGYADLAAGRTDAAVARFGRAVLQAPTYVPALVGRGQAQLAAGRVTAALTDFEAALGLDSSLDAVRRRVEVLRFRVQQEALAEARAAADDGRLEAAAAAFERALTASPDSGMLHRELGSVRERLGDHSAALAHLHRAVALDPEDARAWSEIGQILQAEGDHVEAVKAFAEAAVHDPGPDADSRLAEARDRAAMAQMPPEYVAIAESRQVTRGDLAALVGARLLTLLGGAPANTAVLVTDARGHWAARWIHGVVRAGVMEEYPDHSFRPRQVVHRTDLAQAVSRLLDLVALLDPGASAPWARARPEITDLPPGHLGYPAAARAVAAGVLALDEGGAFQPMRTVTGDEAIRAIARLREFVR